MGSFRSDMSHPATPVFCLVFLLLLASCVCCPDVVIGSWLWEDCGPRWEHLPFPRGCFSRHWWRSRWLTMLRRRSPWLQLKLITTERIRCSWLLCCIWWWQAQGAFGTNEYLWYCWSKLYRYTIITIRFSLHFLVWTNGNKNSSICSPSGFLHMLIQDFISVFHESVPVHLSICFAEFNWNKVQSQLFFHYLFFQCFITGL